MRSPGVWNQQGNDGRDRKKQAATQQRRHRLGIAGKAGEVFTYPNRTGDKYMIVQLKAVNDPTEADLAAADATASSALMSTLDSDLEAAVQAEMAKATKLKVNNAAYNAYKASITTDQ